ncbi:hypothetical protein EYY95_03075 [Hafnia alvei]|uniref:hypothetical protein n=1 Tax=Hafnia alvei TaxID=569 RepID=UPI0010336F3D|nr:hypothetical protein [Hafnia alvei]TBL91134.1 hypothetical protein EYY95_03075 [Hafnia alvei]
MKIDTMDYEQAIRDKIAAHDTFNQLLEKKLTRVKVGTVIMVFLLFGLLQFVIHPRGMVFMTAFIPLLLNCDYLTQDEDDFLTQYLVDRSQQGRDAYERNILHHAIVHSQSED